MIKSRFTWFSVALLAVVVAVAAACGGGEDFGLMSFDDIPEEAPTPVLEPEFALSPKEELLVEVTYVYTHMILLETLQQVNRDMQLLLEYDSKADVDLEWVIEVHDVTARAEEFFDRAASLQVPASMEGKYSPSLLDFLEALQWTGFGSDRLLAASLTVGPSGRSLQVMNRQEEEVFERFKRESEYYLRKAESTIEKELDTYREYLSGIAR